MRRFRGARVIPGEAGQAREMSEQAALAKQTAQAQRAAALARVARAWEAAKAGGLTQDDPDFEPIAGVGLEQFAAVSRGIAAFGHDQSKLVHVIVSAGIPVHHWEMAAQGWWDRIQGNHAVARRFNQFYREAWA
jgi:hypothetical protein